MDETIEKMVKAAKAGGKVLQKYFGETIETVEKSTHFDFVTKADVESEAAILEVLKSEFPDYGVCAEEAGDGRNGADNYFVIDPLDGTNNFVLGVPMFCVSIGLFNKEAAVAGVLYQPVLDQLFYAEKGQGSFLEGKKLSVSKENEVKRSTFAYGCGYSTSKEYLVNMMPALLKFENKRVMLNWCPTFDYCLMAQGTIESVISDGVELHDFAAGKLIAREAGAIVTNWQGQEDKDDKNNRFVLTNNKKVRDFLLSLINQK